MNHSIRILRRWVMVWILTGMFRAEASVQVWTDEAAFLVATGATNASNEIPDLGRVDAPWRGPGVTVSRLPRASALYLGGHDRIDSPLGSPGISVEGFTDLRLEPGLPVHGLGFEFAEAGSGSSGVGAGFVDSVFEVTLWSRTVRVGRVQFNLTNEVKAFVGFTSTRVFDRLELVEIEGPPIVRMSPWNWSVQGTFGTGPSWRAVWTAPRRGWLEVVGISWGRFLPVWIG